ncbi:tRNA pseudouridine synthase D [Aaosphaeria arxii CBS 175.79]|uniref:tRNA pseudouridine synthase D n=1 Tax=Aaosphaeria arxii CBS 175.79 TaxID=1450172 RepID=A0A6A5XFJ4_9PLEO|nr:tRNA pseudouridine synthase D [Aaosphaeria arxii CBS 175.79]KAF2011144.1 tRNA pseudouridine synthase D [Aaosphaeria arxii CBS 175.79]
MGDREEDPRPSKRARLDSPSSTPNAVPTASTPTTSSLQSATATPAAQTTDQDRELRAGITEYVSPGLGFSGVLKQRYTDFLVNEIGLDGRVVHLTSTGVKRPSREPKKKSGGEQGEAEETKGGDVDMKDIGYGPEKKEADAVEEKRATDGTGESDAKANGEDEASTNVSEEDLAALHAIFGEDTTTEVIKLVAQVRKHPARKAKEFKAVLAAPIADKELRTQAHQTLRRVFPNMLESGMEPDQSIRIKARPPAERGNKNKRGGDRDRDTERMRGSLAWEERGGEFLHFTLYKENKDTMEIVGFLGSITGGGSKSYSFAGTKDRRACTVQRVCVKRQSAERMAGVSKKLFNAALGDYEYKKHDLRLGDLMGNEFTITLRDCHFEKEEGLDAAQRFQSANEIVSQAVEGFSKDGFINYYGLQRFGSFAASTDAIGIKLLQENFKGAVDDLLAYSEVALAAAENDEEDPAILVSKDDRARAKGLHAWKTKQDGNEALRLLPKKLAAERNIIQHLSSRNSRTRAYDRLNDYRGALMTIPRNLRLMYVHAYQSLVWNVVAGKRWTTYGSKVVEGDLVLVDEHKDKDGSGDDAAPDTVDQDGEMIINPAGEDSAVNDEDQFERARPLTKKEAESGQYNIWDVVLPQPGFDVEYPRNAIGEFYKEFMGSDRGGHLDPYKMRRSWREISLSGGYRKFLAKPIQPISFTLHEYVKEDEQFVETDLEKLRKQSKKPADEPAGDKKEIPAVESNEDIQGQKKIAVVLSLQLASSQYATVALRELMKAGGVKAYQPQFMGGR